MTNPCKCGIPVTQFPCKAPVIPSKPLQCVNLQEQISLLKELESYMLTMKFPNPQQIYFQDGIIITIRSIIGLQNYLREKHSLPYLLTSQVDQNFQESLHGQLRNDGVGGDRRPTGLALSYRIARTNFTFLVLF